MVPGNFKLTADDPKWPVDLNGKFKQVRFWLDNSYADTANGIQAAPPQSLRIAVLDANGKVLEHFDNFMVGRGPKDTGTPPEWINFKDPAHSESLGITRGTTGPCDQRIAFTLV